MTTLCIHITHDVDDRSCSHEYVNRNKNFTALSISFSVVAFLFTLFCIKLCARSSRPSFPSPPPRHSIIVLHIFLTRQWTVNNVQEGLFMMTSVLCMVLFGLILLQKKKCHRAQKWSLSSFSYPLTAVVIAFSILNTEHTQRYVQLKTRKWN